jgi:flagellar hook assembly protein FlgD
MTPTTAVSGNSSPVSTGDSVSAFRNADFLKIMLSELQNQDPLQPQETGKLVENVQKLQDLANSTYQKYRSDLTWAQQLMGNEVRVQQQPLSEDERRRQVDQGLRPDVGYGSVTGRVSSFRTINQTVYVTINDKDYPMDNIKQLVPQQNDSSHLADMADRLLGKQVAWLNDNGEPQGGTASAVKFASDGSVLVQVGNQAVPFDRITQIGVGS